MAYPDSFLKAVALVLKHEGGYVNDPNDSGEETNWGICKRFHPDVDVKHLTRDQAIEIYFNDYWQAYPQFQLIKDDTYAAHVFDLGVLIGPAKAISFYLVNKNSLEAFQACCRAYFQGVVKAKPSKQKYLRGWLNRVDG